MIERIRSIDKIPKWILFFGIVVSVWFFGQEIWFHKWSYMYDYKARPIKRESTAEWEFVFFTTFLTAFFSYWLLFGLRVTKPEEK